MGWGNEVAKLNGSPADANVTPGLEATPCYKGVRAVTARERQEYALVPQTTTGTMVGLIVGHLQERVWSVRCYDTAIRGRDEEAYRVRCYRGLPQLRSV